jgi:hypothetical protein
MPGNPAYGTDLTFILKKSTNTADSNVSVVKDCIYEALKQFNAAVVDIEGVEDYKQLLNRLDVQRLAVENKKFTIVLRLYNQYNNQVTVSL